MTALVLGILVVAAILLLPSFWFSVMLLLVLGYAAWEWTRLIGLPSQATRIAFLAVLIGLALGLAGFIEYPSIALAILVAGLLFWLYVVQRLLRFAANPAARDGYLKGVVYGLFALLPTWVALVALHRSGDQGPAWVLLLLALVWAADSGAYFSGKRWGRRKLAPAISPGKTVEGVLGGFVVALAVALAGWLALEPQGPGLLAFAVVSAASVGFSVVGDLFESMVKRQRSLKDSGSLLPGHGGMLDRIDSLTAASPVFALGILGVA